MSDLKPCMECGMVCAVGEYHPYAACLMFRACHDGETVRANLDAVRGAAGAQQGLQDIVGLSAGWDDKGSTGPLPPFSWESVGRMALDIARAALALKGQSHE